MASVNPAVGTGALSPGDSARPGEGLGFRDNPWVQLVAGIICMAMISNVQYSWTIFVLPIHEKYHWTTAAIQFSFTLYILSQTWPAPFMGYLADRFGPRLLALVGSLFVAGSWIEYSVTSSLAGLYVGGALSGIGAGLVYAVCIGNALKWFAKRRGLAAGLTAMGFGSGAAITIIPLMHSLVAQGYQRTFLVYGIIQGAIIFAGALALKAAPKRATGGRAPNPRLLHSKVDSTPKQTLRSLAFWMMYIDFTLVAASGLIATAGLSPIAHSFGVAMLPVTLLGFTMPVLTYALSINNIMNGLSRVIFGWVSDLIGREMTMFLTFFAQGVGIFALEKYGRSPVWFVILAGLVFFAWGNIYGIFPALTSDQYGQKYATTNYALLYTAKGAAAFFVPLGSYLAVRAGGWSLTLDIMALANIVAAVMMLALVRPLRVREIRKQEQQASLVTAP